MDFYIQDDGSLNKTSLNGEEITGKGKRLLHDGDQIEVAGVLMIRFSIR
jgi:pSer/pThr/pTyr-binding forkhead associated (FHA) protein